MYRLSLIKGVLDYYFVLFVLIIKSWKDIRSAEALWILSGSPSLLLSILAEESVATADDIVDWS